jgi:hypothetical protein
MPKKKVTLKPKQTKSPKKEPSKRKTMRSSEEVKGIFYDESALHSDESEFESDDENESQPRIDEDLESSSSEEEKKDTDEDESDEDEAETEYEDSDEEIRPSSKKFRLSSSTVLKAKKLKTKKPKTHKEPKWKWRRIHYNKKYADLQQIKRDNNLNPEPLNTFSNPLKGKKENPIYYLQLLLDNKFFEKVIHGTNLAKKISQELKKNGIENNADSHRMTRSMTRRNTSTMNNVTRRRSHTVKWKDLTVAEFKIFLGLFYWMGLMRLPEMEDHWSMDTIFRNLDFTAYMSRDRFLQILRSMKFHNSAAAKEEEISSPENRLSVLMYSVLDNSRKFYTPSSTLSLDESMVSFKGRHKDKVFMPSKPIRIGFKAFVVCEADTGFLLEWKMYNKREGKEKKNRIVNTVKSLLGFNRYQSKAVYMDRYYSNKEVFEELLDLGIYACGTIKPSKVGITEEMKIQIQNVKKEQAIFYKHNEKLLLCVWRTHKDKLVYILSSILDNSMQDSKRYCTEEKKEIQIKRPAILEAYNENMRGVDYFDRYLRFYSFLHGSKKWYLKIAYYFLTVALLNSYVIYQQEHGTENSVSRKQYIISIIYSLLGMRRNRYIIRKSDCCLIRKEVPRICSVCSAPGNRRRTRYYCETCTFYVCADGCYDEHRRMI